MGCGLRSRHTSCLNQSDTRANRLPPVPIREISVKYRLHNTRTLTHEMRKTSSLSPNFEHHKRAVSTIQTLLPKPGGWGGSGGLVHPVPLPIILSKNIEVSRWISYPPHSPHSHQGSDYKNTSCSEVLGNLTKTNSSQSHAGVLSTSKRCFPPTFHMETSCGQDRTHCTEEEGLRVEEAGSPQ